MEEKQVGVRPIGIYYICPHCNTQMRVDYYCNFCPDCGEKLNWNNVKEFNEINSHMYGKLRC
jgi:transcription initiation factor IIE alpha subunit